MEYDFNILYYINMYKKWGRKIILVMIISMFFTMCFSLMMPVTYVSTVTLLSTDEGSSTQGSLGKFLGISGLSGSSSTDIIAPLLNSRRMSKDISDQFSLNKKPKFRYKIDTADIKGTFIVKVTGQDPVLIQKIANFAVLNLDKINMELDITPKKPMVKILDPAIPGTRESRQTPRKMFVAGLLSFLLISVYAFFLDYLRKLKSQ
ncbi:MAG: hypothetical protein KKH08_07685 [Candidatus Omnitrophica bacterium]|nr:hypothetical protein [Candidatus Omnitrophota bacterium]